MRGPGACGRARAFKAAFRPSHSWTVRVGSARRHLSLWTGTDFSSFGLTDPFLQTPCVEQ